MIKIQKYFPTEASDVKDLFIKIHPVYVKLAFHSPSSITSCKSSISIYIKNLQQQNENSCCVQYIQRF
jgi:hypothetical protein